MRYSATTPESRREMLEAVGAESIEDLLSTIPADVRVDGELDIPGPWPEADLRKRLKRYESRVPRYSFVGAGLYEHYIPTPVDSLCARSEWVTSYTPYQAELAQGTLAMYYEFQSYIAMLTGQEFANGGMYDGSTSLAEAVLMAMRVQPKADPVVYVSEAVHPDYRAVLQTYMRFVGVEVATIPFDAETGRTRLDVDADARKNAVATIVQSPNFFGVVEDLGDSHEGFTIGVCTEPLSMAWLKPLPVDIMVGECQSFGIPIQLGGPTAGFFATKKKWVRKSPGRLVGRTEDAEGNEAFCITLATREQFIRREKATSNICTSSGLMCLRATVYLSLLGREGLQGLARKNASAARFFAAGLEELGLKRRHTGAIFNELVIDASAKPDLYEKLLAKDILLGLPLESRYPEMKNCYLLAATELHYQEAEAILQEIKSMHSIPEKTIFPYAGSEIPGFEVVAANPPVDAFAPDDIPRSEDGCGGMEQVTEIDVIRHYTRLSTLNYDIDRGMYPLGSCTMKHNPRLNEAIAAEPYWANPHPLWPDEFLEGHKRIMDEIEQDLREVSGFDRVCLLPAAGAHGELTSTFMMKRYHEDRGNVDKNVILTPDTAHGTNPASAAMAGFKCRQIESGPDGYLRFEDVEPFIDDSVAGLMVTNPNTLGIYEADFKRIADALHERDALIYMDGANFNAVMGIFKPGEIGADVMHWNLHKTFTTPHGGGGPGSGPIGYNEKLAPYAPGSGDERSIGPVKAFLGQWGMFIRTWCYIRSLGGSGLKEVSEEAILNANYVRKHLAEELHLPYETPTLHETVFTDKNLPNGVITKDLAKRLIDYGFHPPTVYFPIMVSGAIMVEPTETEPKHEMDRFIDAVRSIVREAAEDPDVVKTAPHTAPVKRVDETLAARRLDLGWAAE